MTPLVLAALLAAGGAPFFQMGSRLGLVPPPGLAARMECLCFMSDDGRATIMVTDAPRDAFAQADSAEGFAAELSKPATAHVDGLVWKLDISALADWIVSAAQLAPKQTPESQKGMKQAQKWVKPFHAMRGHIFQENNIPRQSFTWEITDLVSFD